MLCLGVFTQPGERGDVRHRAALRPQARGDKKRGSEIDNKAKSNGLPPHVESYGKVRPIVALRVSVETLGIARPCGPKHEETKNVALKSTTRRSRTVFLLTSKATGKCAR